MTQIPCLQRQSRPALHEEGDVEFIVEREVGRGRRGGGCSLRRFMEEGVIRQLPHLEHQSRRNWVEFSVVRDIGRGGRVTMQLPRLQQQSKPAAHEQGVGERSSMWYGISEEGVGGVIQLPHLQPQSRPVLHERGRCGVQFNVVRDIGKGRKG